MHSTPLAIDREHILRKTGDLWEPLRGQRVFVTGGTGFVGTWLMEAFVAANAAHNLGARAVLLTRDPSRFAAKAPHLANDPSVDFIVGGATSFESPSDSYPFVIHAATERWFEANAEHPLGILGPDLLATQRILEFARSHGTRRLLFTSSGAAYGPSAAGLDRVPEEYLGAPDPSEARAGYGESKRISEFACTSYGRTFGFDAVVARLFAFVGPYLPLTEGYAVGNFLADALAGRTITIGGDGTPRRSYLYAADLAIWLWTMLLRGAAGRIYNVGSPDPVTIRGLAESIVRSIRPDLSITVARAAIDGAAPHNYVPDVARAARELGLLAWTSLDDALQRTYSFHLASRRTPAEP